MSDAAPFVENLFCGRGFPMLTPFPVGKTSQGNAEEQNQQ
jgi:hypothetical protein